MKSYLPARAYWSDEIFTQEQSYWERQWQFAGFRRDLAQHHDFVTAQIGHRPVVIQNFHGELKAFDNVCSHRFSRIQTEPCGNRPLQCRYHGWAYNSAGDPVGIPQKPRFEGMDSIPAESLRLPAWKVATLGEFVFVARDSNRTDLNSFLSSSEAELRQIGESLGRLIDVNRIPIKANWKVVVENTLEAYHVDFVHANNFKKVLAEQSTFDFHRPHSWWRSPLRDPVVRAMAPVGRMMNGRNYQPPGYVHAFVFPNLTVGTTLGLSFAVQHFIPRGAAETEFVSYVFAAKTASEDASPSAMVEAMNDSAVKFNRDVFEEDRVVVEQVQLGIRHAERPGLLSEDEVRIQAFQQAYIEHFDFELLSAI